MKLNRNHFFKRLTLTIKTMSMIQKSQDSEIMYPHTLLKVIYRRLICIFLDCASKISDSVWQLCWTLTTLSKEGRQCYTVIDWTWIYYLQNIWILHFSFSVFDIFATSSYSLGGNIVDIQFTFQQTSSMLTIGIQLYNSIL